MSLEAIYVHDDWEERADGQRQMDRKRWHATLVTIVVALTLTLVVRNLPFRDEVSRFLADGVAYALYLTLGAWAVCGRTRGRLVAFLCIYSAILGCLVVGAVVSQDGTLGHGAFLAFCWVVSALVLAGLGWGTMAYVMRRCRRDTRLRRLDPRSWPRSLLWGLLGGASVTAYLFLSAHFSGVTELHLRLPTLLLLYKSVYVVAVRSFGEELLFRGLALDYLYRRRERSFWFAALITLTLNLAIYVVLMPSTTAPSMVAILLLGSSVMIVVNCALYVRERNLVSPSASNMVFQMASLWLV